MIDYCTPKRIFTFAVALIGFSVLVFLVEEYAEESQEANMAIKSAGNKAAFPAKHINHSSSDCWVNEEYIVLQSCMQCSDFEMRALNTKHCMPTGYYDRLNCTKSGIQALRPCATKSDGSQSSFYAFAIINVILLLLSYTVATKRKEALDQVAYMRVAQQFDEP